jgi:GTPase SAR1 family protein
MSMWGYGDDRLSVDHEHEYSQVKVSEIDKEVQKNGVEHHVRLMDSLVGMLHFPCCVTYLGQDEYVALRDQRMRIANGFIVMYSVTDSMNEIPSIVDNILRVKDASYANEVPIVICGNKMDITESERVVTKEEGEEMASKCGVQFFESSGKNNINVDEVIDSIISQTIEVRKPCMGYRKKRQCNVM